MYQKLTTKAPHRTAEAVKTNGRGKNDTNMIGFRKRKTRKLRQLSSGHSSKIIYELTDPLYYSVQGAVLSRLRHPFLFFQNVLHQFIRNIRAGGMGSMKRSRATLSQLHSQRRSSPINSLREANQSVAFAAGTNIDTLVI